MGIRGGGGERERPEARVDVRHLPIVCAARIRRLAV